MLQSYGIKARPARDRASVKPHLRPTGAKECGFWLRSMVSAATKLGQEREKPLLTVRPRDIVADDGLTLHPFSAGFVLYGNVPEAG